MKKIATEILFVLLATSVFSQYDNTIKWQSGLIKIDGNIADWQSSPRFYDNDTKLAFDIRNDSNNLYLVLQVPDQTTQFQIARAGMNITFNTKIKPQRKAVIVFSPFITEKQGPHNKNIGEKKGPSLIKQKYLLMPPDVQGSGFSHTNGDLSTDYNSKNIIYSVDWDTLNKMNIEFKIPLRELFSDSYELKEITPKEISMTLKENAQENPGYSGEGSSSGMGNGQEGMGNGGTRGFNNSSGDLSGEAGATGGHQYGSGGAQNGMSMFEAKTYKYKFRLNGNLQ